jgi:hypothetical protein
MKRRFGTGFVVGVVLTAIGLAATAAVAGTGVGGVFNLGRINKVDAGTTLSGGAPKLLIIKNTGTGPSAVGLAITVPAGKPPLQVSSNARVANLNSDLLDGNDSTDFVNGHGSYQQNQVDMPFAGGDGVEVLVHAGFFRIRYVCPNSEAEDGTFRITNLTTGNVDTFIDHGGASPEYTVIPTNATSDRNAAHAGDRIQIQLASPTSGVADITMFSVHRGSDCHVQALATVAS